MKCIYDEGSPVINFHRITHHMSCGFILHDNETQAHIANHKVINKLEILTKKRKYRIHYQGEDKKIAPTASDNGVTRGEKGGRRG